MRISHRYLTRKNIVFTATGLLIIILLSFYYFYAVKGRVFGWTPAPQSSPVKTSPASVASRPATGSSPQPSPSSPNATNSTSASGQSPVAAAPNTPPAKTPIKAAITAIQQNEHALHISTMLDISTNAGSCTITLAGPPAHPIIQTSGVQANSTASACVGFDIPIAQLSPGQWQITLTFENDDHTASATQTTLIH